MSAPQRLPALRVKLPCEDEKDFFARLADTIAEKGLRIPTANLRPIGTRVRLALEFRNADSVSGEGVVDAHLEGPRPAMNIRILRFERSHPGAPAQGHAAAAAPAAAPPVAPDAPPAPDPASPAPPPEVAASPAPEISFGSLFEDEERAEGDAASADATRQIPPLHPDGAAAQPKDEAREAVPEPTPPPQGLAPSTSTSLPVASRRAMIAAAIAAAVLVVGILAYSLVRRPVTPAAPPQLGAPAAAVSDAQLASQIAIADRRFADGRLTGPDGALDHLLGAKAMAPGDPRVKQRLELLADTLEKLGARAVERGDVAEAEVHLAGALAASPDRASIAEKLEALAKVPKARDARSRGDRPPPQGQ